MSQVVVQAGRLHHNLRRNQLEVFEARPGAYSGGIRWQGRANEDE